MNLLYYVFFLSFINFSNQKRLLFSLLHIRHGARETNHLFNESAKLNFQLNKISKAGVLTPVGERMLFVLGAVNRRKFGKFLKEEYDKSEVLVESSRFKRSINSAFSYIQGLYLNNTTLNNLKKNDTVQLSERQIKNAVPPLDHKEINNEYIQDIIKKLGKNPIVNNTNIKMRRNVNFLRFSSCNNVKKNIKINLQSEKIKN